MAPRDGWSGSRSNDEGAPGPTSPPARLLLDQLQRHSSPTLTQHHARVGKMSEQLARKLGLNDEVAQAIGMAGRLHDIGMTLVPQDLVERAGPLAPSERALIRRHTQWGHELLTLTGDPTLAVAAQVALEHHERWDGSGYPFGLKGDAISLAARIVAVCAFYDSLCHAVPHREALDPGAALALISVPAENGSPAFDPEVIAAFAALLAEVGELPGRQAA